MRGLGVESVPTILALSHRPHLRVSLIAVILSILLMKKTKATKKTEDEPKEKKPPGASKFGVLGKDLSSRFSSKGNRAWHPTKPGGRNGQGKP